MTVDPLERLRAADPARDCPAPPIEPLWRRLELEQMTADSTHQGRARSQRRSFPHAARLVSSASGVLAVGIAIAVAAGVLALLGGRSSAPHRREPSPPASAETPAAVSPAPARRRLVRSVALLQRAQTRADRQAGRLLGQEGLLPAYLTTQLQARACRASRERAPGCGTRIEHSLIRRLPIFGSSDRALMIPMMLTQSVSDMPRGQFGVVFALAGPHIGVSSSSTTGGGSGGEALSSRPLTPVAAFERRGAIASYDVRRPGQWATGTDRIAIFVPDHVTHVTLADLSLANVRTGRALARLPDLSATVHANVATMQIAHLTLTRFGQVVHQASLSQSTAGSRCSITARVNTVLATAHVSWRRDGHEQQGGRVSLFLYLDASPKHPTRSHSSYCQRQAARGSSRR
jgi:hypothetical protein